MGDKCADTHPEVTCLTHGMKAESCPLLPTTLSIPAMESIKNLNISSAGLLVGEKSILVQSGCGEYESPVTMKWDFTFGVLSADWQP